MGVFCQLDNVHQQRLMITYNFRLRIGVSPEQFCDRLGQAFSQQWLPSTICVFTCAFDSDSGVELTIKYTGGQVDMSQLLKAGEMLASMLRRASSTDTSSEIVRQRVVIVAPIMFGLPFIADLLFSSSIHIQYIFCCVENLNEARKESDRLVE